MNICLLRHFNLLYEVIKSISRGLPPSLSSLETITIPENLFIKDYFDNEIPPLKQFVLPPKVIEEILKRQQFLDHYDPTKPYGSYTEDNSTSGKQSFCPIISGIREFAITLRDKIS